MSRTFEPTGLRDVPCSVPWRAGRIWRVPTSILWRYCNEAQTTTLLDVNCLETRLSDLLGRKTDFVEDGTLRPVVREAADRDQVQAF